MCEEVGELVSRLAGIVAGLVPGEMSPGIAKGLVGQFSRLEHLAAAGKTVLAQRVASSQVYEGDGHRHAGEWLSKESGEPLGAALSVLEAGERLVRLPELKDAFCAGELSASQAKELAAVAIGDPSSLGELLEAARSEDFEGLRRRCAKVRAAQLSKEDETEQDRRVHLQRRVRTWSEPDGTFRLDARLTRAAGARVLAHLFAERDKIFSEARRCGSHEPTEAYLADALVELVTGTGDSGRPGPKALVHLRVDLAALRRGCRGPGELCEIAGVGPVSVETARELCGDSITRLLVTSATDVHAVCNLGRSVPARLHDALVERDSCCVVPGCSATRGLETDHRVVPFSSGGPTEMDNLARICHFHHFLKTHEGFSLEGGPGAWVWRHPDGSRHSAREEPPPERGDDEAPPGPKGQLPAGTATPRRPPPDHGEGPGGEGSLFRPDLDGWTAGAGVSPAESGEVEDGETGDGEVESREAGKVGDGETGASGEDAGASGLVA